MRPETREWKHVSIEWKQGGCYKWKAKGQLTKEDAGGFRHNENRRGEDGHNPLLTQTQKRREKFYERKISQSPQSIRNKKRGEKEREEKRERERRKKREEKKRRKKGRKKWEKKKGRKKGQKKGRNKREKHKVKKGEKKKGRKNGEKKGEKKRKKKK